MVDAEVVTVSEKGPDGKMNRKQLEVDFVCDSGQSRYYIQSAFSLHDENRPFSKIGDSFKKTTIPKDIVLPAYDDGCIPTVNIYDFLLDPKILNNSESGLTKGRKAYFLER